MFGRFFSRVCSGLCLHVVGLLARQRQPNKPPGNPPKYAVKYRGRSSFAGAERCLFNGIISMGQSSCLGDSHRVERFWIEVLEGLVCLDREGRVHEVKMTSSALCAGKMFWFPLGS